MTADSTVLRPTDVLIVAGNSRSLIANRGDLIGTLRSRGLTVAAAVPKADYLPETEQLGVDVHQVTAVNRVIVEAIGL